MPVEFSPKLNPLGEPVTFRRNRNTGSFILTDPGTNETVAAGMIL